MFIKITRLESSNAGIRGILSINGTIFATTLEPPWKNNEKNISCIPGGNYKCRKYTSKRHGRTLKIEGVINRSGIIFHVGNTLKDTEGCVLLGDNFAKRSVAVESSASAFHRFKEKIEKETMFSLLIKS